MKPKRPPLDLAGIDLEGATILRTVLPEAEPPGKPWQRAWPGTQVACFKVEARATPWKAPSTTRTGHAYKDKRLVAWQATVAAHGRLAMEGMAPYPWPVRLDLKFHLTRKAGSTPDLSNLVKATEDALQGSVIVNDRQVCHATSLRIAGDQDAVIISVIASEDQ